MIEQDDTAAFEALLHSVRNGCSDHLGPFECAAFKRGEGCACFRKTIDYFRSRHDPEEGVIAFA